MKVLLILALLTSALFVLYSESYIPFYPHIDTVLPPEFSEEKFYSIQKGWNKKQVKELLGTPTGEYSSHWIYGEDNNAPFGDFAWVGYEISFDQNGLVSNINRIVYRD